MSDDYDATLFDPNPWGARQRMLPRATFRVRASSPPARPPKLAFPISAPVFALHEAEIMTMQIPRSAAVMAPRWLVRLAVSSGIVAGVLAALSLVH